MAELIAVKYASKASGVYREIIDATQSNLQVAAPCNVVVVIQSEKGPVMKPVYVADKTQLHTMFGNRDARLEAKGCYGILMAEHVLEQGPIWVFNVKNINPQSETLMVKKLACSNAEKDSLHNMQINQVYDTNKFWNIPLVYGTYGDGATLSFSSVLNGTSTVIVERYVGDDYAYSVGKTKEMHESFLGQGLDDDALVSDYLVKVHVFKTDLLTAKLKVENAIINGQVNLDKLEEIMADASAQYYATYTGSIGNVIDIDGNNLNVVKTINADTYAHGIYAAVNNDAFMKNGLDICGKGAFVFDESGAELPIVQKISRLGYTVNPIDHEIEVKVNRFNRNEAFFKGDIGFTRQSIFADLEKTLRINDYKYIGDTYELANEAIGSIAAPVQPNGKPYPKNINGQPVYDSESAKAGQPIEIKGDFIIDYREVTSLSNNPLSLDMPTLKDGVNVQWTVQAMVNGQLVEKQITSTGLSSTDGMNAQIEKDLKVLFDSFLIGLDFIVTSGDKIVVTPNNIRENCHSFRVIKVTALEEGAALADAIDLHADGTIEIAAYKVEDQPVIVETSVNADDKDVIISAKVTTYEYSETPAVDSDGNETGETNVEKGPEIESNDIDVNAVIESYGNPTKNYRIVFDQPIAETADEVSGKESGTTETIVTTTVTVTTLKVKYLDEWTKLLNIAKPIVLTGIKSLERHFVNGTQARQNDILDMMNSEGIVNAFTDPTVFRCRYMVDTFKTYVEPNAKNQYATLADAAKRFLVFSPGPFYHELLSSKNPDFHDLLGQFRMQYVKNGQNPDKPSTNTFSFTQSLEGSKYMVFVMNGYYNDGFSDMLCPYVGALAKLYYAKHTGTKKVYDIVAGQDWPLAAEGMGSPEFEPDINERAYMEQMGLNVVQRLNGVTQLRSNKTAFQFASSAFNYPETLEKVFFVSDAVEPTLDGKLFKYNNADNRLAVKKKADSICDILVSDGAISRYVNTCDLSNNDIEVRKAGIIILDTELYNEFGIRIAVHRSTIRTEEA